MVQGNSGELHSLAGLTASYAASLEGLAQQIASCVNAAASSWQDGTRPKIEEQLGTLAGQLQSMAQGLRGASDQIGARANHYEELESS